MEDLEVTKVRGRMMSWWRGVVLLY
jgi:hypothetical protein